MVFPIVGDLSSIPMVPQEPIQHLGNYWVLTVQILSKEREQPFRLRSVGEGLSHYGSKWGNNEG